MMKTSSKRYIFVFLAIALVGLAGFLYLGATHSDQAFWCEAHYLSPTSYPTYNQACPLYLIFEYSGLPGLALLLSLIPLFFLREAVYLVWRKFAIWTLPIMALIIGATSPYKEGFLPIGPDREEMAMLLSILFLLISYILIIYKALKGRKQKPEAPADPVG